MLIQLNRIFKLNSFFPTDYVNDVFAEVLMNLGALKSKGCSLHCSLLSDTLTKSIKEAATTNQILNQHVNSEYILVKLLV